MVDRKVLAAHGCSSENYKKIWTKDPIDLSKPQRRLLDLIRNRIYDARCLGLKEWRAYHAIDLAYELPFNQTTPTIVRHLCSRNLSEQDTMAELRSWGCSPEDMFYKASKPNGEQYWELNVPLFFQVGIPLVKAYSTMRLANLFNQRNTNPLLLYQPSKLNVHDQALCEITTDMVDSASGWYGYPALLRQMLTQMVKYGIALSFPREEWDVQYHLQPDPDNPKKFRKRVEKEGIRYFVQHPTRMAYDLTYPLTSLNTDTGTEWALAWRVTNYGQVLDNKLYYNRNKIFTGTNWFSMPEVGQYFKEVYPCSMKFPVGGAWAEGRFQREDKASWYSSDQRDQSIFVTETFMKIIPKVYDLGTYPYPVWHRFTVAGDDTIIWCNPCLYTPSWFMGWDYDENASKTSSMALECIPWQDTLGNILSQIILTAKQNLLDVTFYDNQQINEEDIRRFRNLGENKYRSKHFIGFDSLKSVRSQHSPQNAFFSPTFQKQNVQELMGLIPMVLTIMERVLQITAQEVGAAASHQQSKKEIETTGQASSSRVMLTFSAIDEGIDAWKRQQFDANMAYRNDDLEAEVSADLPDIQNVVKELGFEIVRKGKEVLVVKGKKKILLRLESFARNGEGNPLQGDKEVAAAILQAVNIICGQEDLHKEVGAANLLAMIEYASKLSGAPNGFRLKVVPEDQRKDDKEVDPNVLEAIKAAQQATLKAIEEKMAKPIAAEVHQDQQKIAGLEQIVTKLQQIYDIAAKTQDKNAIKAQDAAAAIRRKDEQSAKDQQRKDAALAAEQRRLDAKAAADHQRETAKTAAEIKLKEAEAQAAIEIKKAEAAAKPPRQS